MLRTPESFSLLPPDFFADAFSGAESHERRALSIALGSTCARCSDTGVSLGRFCSCPAGETLSSLARGTRRH